MKQMNLEQQKDEEKEWKEWQQHFYDVLPFSVLVSVSVSASVFRLGFEFGFTAASNKVIIITSSLLAHKTKFISFTFMH